jgi:ATP-dependent DNA helicase RecG
VKPRTAFRISEEDLKLRGEGEVLGRGNPERQASRSRASRRTPTCWKCARDDARLLLSRDPELQGERGAAIRLLLYLFGRDEAVRLLRAG